MYVSLEKVKQVAKRRGHDWTGEGGILLFVQDVRQTEAICKLYRNEGRKTSPVPSLGVLNEVEWILAD
jgi:hypothetical protein